MMVTVVVGNMLVIIAIATEHSLNLVQVPHTVQTSVL